MPNPIRSFPTTWRGDLLLACRKCKRKLKGEPGMRALAKLKKTVKKHSKAFPSQVLHVINVPCMDLCPKGGVTICDAVRDPGRLLILYDEKGLEQLFQSSE